MAMRRSGPALAAAAAALAERRVQEVFCAAAKGAQRGRAAVAHADKRLADPVLGAVARRLLDRLEDCTRTFPHVVVLGGAADVVAKSLDAERCGVERVVHVDAIPECLDAARAAGAHLAAGGVEREFVQGPEDTLAGAEPESADAVIACLGLHWVNDLPGAVRNARRVLKPDGLFLAAIFGGNTLQELRIACHLAETEREGGVSVRVSPMAQVRDAGTLLSNAGLALASVDVDEFTVNYPDADALVGHLRVMGEQNVDVRRRPGPMRRDTALAMAAAYKGMFADEETGAIPATYQVIYLSGFAPAPTQRGAAQRGSATVSLEDLARTLPPSGVPMA